jgi:hypothetical protein
VEFTADLTRAAWIAPRLGRFGTVTGLVPTGFEAYVRIFHPFSITSTEGESRELSWAQLAALNGRIFHPLAQAGGLGVQQGQEAHSGVEIVDPAGQGWLDGRRLATLIGLLTPATTAAGVTVGIWVGWGQLHPESMSVFYWPAPSAAELRELNRRYRAERAAAIDPRLAAAIKQRRGRSGPDVLHLPHRAYALLTGWVAELTDPDWGSTAGIGWRGEDRSPGPQLIWPDDLAWFIGTGLDADFTLVGCTRHVAEAILACPDLESLEVPADGDLSWDGDTLNPAFT